MSGQLSGCRTSALQPFPFAAMLVGGNEVPPVATVGSGRAILGFDPTQTALSVILTANNLRQVTEAHIHIGSRTENGPVVLFLFRPMAPVDIAGPTVLTNATFTAADLIGPLAGMPLSVLADQIRIGNAYVNVHTRANPAGEIRGQIVPKG